MEWFLKGIWYFGKEYKDAIIAYGTIFSAFGIVYSIGLQNRNSRAQRISDNRVRWIEELRKNLAKYLTDLTRISDIEGEDSPHNDEEETKLFQKLHETKLVILLSLNLQEHKELIDGLDQVYLAAKELGLSHKDPKKFEKSLKDFKKIKSDIILTSSKIFKAEWLKAKEGK